MPLQGVIANRTQALLPVTWDALLNDPRIGEAPLQYAVDTAKELVTGTVVAPTAENQYSRVVVNYIAKVAALNIIPGGIDYWMNQANTANTQQPIEIESFTDRAAQLEKQRDRLEIEVARDEWDIRQIVGYQLMKGRSVPQNSRQGDVFLTPDPNEFPRPYIQTNRS